MRHHHGSVTRSGAFARRRHGLGAQELARRGRHSSSRNKRGRPHDKAVGLKKCGAGHATRTGGDHGRAPTTGRTQFLRLANGFAQSNESPGPVKQKTSATSIFPFFIIYQTSESTVVFTGIFTPWRTNCRRFNYWRHTCLTRSCRSTCGRGPGKSEDALSTFMAKTAATLCSEDV